jgi:hypothetical protein
MTGAATFFSSATPVRWQQRSANAQPLLLSRTPVFDVASHGAILGPGMRYRLIAVNAGVAELEVETEQGLEIGYCPAQLIGAHRSANTRFTRPWAISMAVAAVAIAGGFAAWLI